MNTSLMAFGVILILFAMALVALRHPLGRYATKRYKQIGVKQWVKSEQWWSRFTLAPGGIIAAVGVVLIFTGAFEHVK